MGYTKPYIPRADSAFRSMAEKFAHGVSSHPAQYMMTPAEAAPIMQQFQSFKQALSRATNENTRTKGAICDKDDARSILRHTIRAYSAFIRCNDGITDGDKIAIGVRPRNIGRTRRNCEGMVPLLQYIGSTPGIDELRYHDSNTPNSKAKPRNAERLELWVAYAEAGQPQPKVSAAKPVGSFKKSKMLVPQDPVLDSRMGGSGKPTYWGRWVGYDGQPGQWSLPLRTSIPAMKAASAGPNADAARDVETIRLEDEAERQPLKKAA